jgi:hypothetical protein
MGQKLRARLHPKTITSAVISTGANDPPMPVMDIRILETGKTRSPTPVELETNKYQTASPQ